ncbi:hypothetical protein BG46_17550 [Brucella anthropi]|nr:hypothetical protein BG46_17550 [Brucella anthropi]
MFDGRLLTIAQRYTAVFIDIAEKLHPVNGKRTSHQLLLRKSRSQYTKGERVDARNIAGIMPGLPGEVI